MWGIRRCGNSWCIGRRVRATDILGSNSTAGIPATVSGPTFGGRRPLGGTPLIILGIVLLVVGFLLKIAIVWTLGIIALVVGLLLVLLGSIGHAVGGRRHYY